MPRNYADEVDLIEQKLQDTSNAEFVAAEINYAMEEGLKEFSSYHPHIVEVPFSIESRHGSSTSTSASNLVDSGKSQFASADATNEKVVYNVTDHTRATIVSYSTTSQVGLSADIFTVGEQYRIFNKRCKNNKQIFIGDAGDYLDVLRAEYPTAYWPRSWRNVRLFGKDILELRLDLEPYDSRASLNNNNEVMVEFRRAHILSQLTDWEGEVNNGAGYAAGSTSMAINGLQATGTIEEGEEFTLENLRQVYTVTADATIASNAATITFFPGLEAAVVDNDDIAFIKSTLTQEQEELLASLVAARLLISKSVKFLNSVPKGGPNVWQNYATYGERLLGETLSKLKRDTPAITRRTYSTL